MNGDILNFIKKCSTHDSDFVLLCVVCLTPICLYCIVSGEHLNHKMDHFTKENIYNIKSSKKCYSHTKTNYEQQKPKIRENFKELHDRLDSLKNSKLLELEKDQSFSQIFKKYYDYLNVFKDLCPELLELQKKDSVFYNINSINNNSNNNCGNKTICEIADYL
ncbi:hypothetical protein DICPUDRAFT_83393 [Dictyostelium purpureum]|uniref:B box-type domain-containing protein n=1 Tax=Dictyostelium purpureum TaxID=5786 RepID=F0ZZE4_DICPU|nr:uncharacterized protein DICPUDRAFT_83393 [Dictyostelium purpureum]EGC30693.1 hypothetical protein DICPUDRAFT_83393 [Dictyostelium purpureum]|eukprot:XP_003292791.1 hypothetical protein DICPUDRAFT_83393 [Dictyostelium purpureum]